MTDNCAICQTPPGSMLCEECWKAYAAAMRRYGAPGMRNAMLNLVCWAARRARKLAKERRLDV